MVKFNEDSYVLGVRIKDCKIHENTKLENKNIYIKLTSKYYTINDEMIGYFNLFNFKIKKCNEDTIYSYDGYMNNEIINEVLYIVNNGFDTKFYLLKSYFFEYKLRKNYRLDFYDENNKKVYKKPKDIRKKKIFFNIGLNEWDLAYYINLSNKNYQNKIKDDIKNNKLKNIDLTNDMFIINADLIPIYFKNELLRNNRGDLDFLSNIIHRQENNFFIFTKDLHGLLSENNILLEKMELFNYYNIDCCIEEGWKECIYYGKIDIINKNKIDILQDRIQELSLNLNLNENILLEAAQNIIIPTEVTNEEMFEKNVRIIFEEIIKTVTDSDILKQLRDNLPNYKPSPKDPPEVMNKYLAQITGESEKHFHSLINPIKNFRNMYSHNKGSYKKNYEENYKFVRNGEFNKYRLNEDPRKNDFNFLSHKIIEDVNGFLETINIYFKDKKSE